MLNPILVLAGACLLAPGVQEPAARPAPSREAQETVIELEFGVYQTDKATEMYRRFTPVLEWLEKDASRRLGKRISIDLKIFKTYDEGLKALVDGSVDLVRFGPASYVLAKQGSPGIRILVREEKKGRTSSKGVIFVREDSSIRTLADVRGRSFAFGDPNSTIGRYLAQRQLIEAGVFAKDLSGFEFLDRHDKVVRSVQMGDHDVGSAKEGTYLSLQDKRRPLRIISSFPNVTKPWICRAKLPADQVAALRNALLSCQSPEVQKACKVTGFVGGKDTDYKDTRAAIQRARNFERVRPK